ncbi:MAG: aspartyl protease family protein [Burkholderiaceae bacterium]|nr:aspartyl protease family protein [Burkholderiaceae bacterium]
MNALLAATLALGAADAADEPAADRIVAAILAANQAAVGSPRTRSAVTLEYRYVGSGLTGTRTEQVDLVTGAYVETTVAGGITEGDGFDGTTPWQRDISGTYTPQQGGDRIPAAVASAYRRANLWWRADRGGAAIAYIGRENDASRSLTHFSVTPKGGKRFDAWLDSETHLLTRVAYDQEFLHVTERYSDYRHEGPQVLAHAIERDPGLGEPAIDHLTLLHCDYVPAVPLTAYSQPRTPVTGAIIADNASSATVPFRLLNNHVYVEGTVDGKGPYTFIVDTGGHTLLSPHLIKEVGLKPIGEAVTSGAGEGHGTTGFVRFDEIAIGAVQLRNQDGFATDIYDKTIEGIPVDGMIGFELVRRMVMTIDYGRHMITFTQPDRFEATADSGVGIPFVFYDHLPNVAGRIADLPARFDIDTGSRSALDVTTPFVVAHRLRERYRKGTNAVTGYGVGGPVHSYVVQTPSVAIGNITIEDPIVGLSEARSGSFSDPNFDGNVGSGLLKRFVVTFDYARQLMYLKRIEPVPPDVGTFDRSGLWINAHGDGYEVMDVAPGSAAAQVGLAVGDLITLIDGRPASDAGLSDTRQRWRSEPPGTQVQLTVRRGSEMLNVTLVLRDQV